MLQGNFREFQKVSMVSKRIRVGLRDSNLLFQRRPRGSQLRLRACRGVPKGQGRFTAFQQHSMVSEDFRGFQKVSGGFTVVPRCSKRSQGRSRGVSGHSKRFMGFQFQGLSEDFRSVPKFQSISGEFLGLL